MHDELLLFHCSLKIFLEAWWMDAVILMVIHLKAYHGGLVQQASGPLMEDWGWNRRLDGGSQNRWLWNKGWRRGHMIQPWWLMLEQLHVWNGCPCIRDQPSSSTAVSKLPRIRPIANMMVAMMSVLSIDYVLLIWIFGWVGILLWCYSCLCFLFQNIVMINLLIIVICHFNIIHHFILFPTWSY